MVKWLNGYEKNYWLLIDDLPLREAEVSVSDNGLWLFIDD